MDDEFELEISDSPEEETIWLTQRQIEKLFDKSVSKINEHIKNILSNELNDKDVIRKFGKTELSNAKTKPIL